MTTYINIDELIAAAPDVPPPVFDIKIDKVWAGYKEFPKVRYKTYTLLNCKSVLRAFKKKRAYTPKKTGGRPVTKPLNKRVVGDDMEYTMPYKPRRVTKLPETLPDRKHAGLYGAGFFCNNHYMVRIPKPKTKRPIKAAHDQMLDMIEAAHPGNGAPVTVIEETYQYAGRVSDKAIANFYGAEGRVPVSAVLLDVIYKYYPDARASYVNKTIYFFTEGTLVGMMMPVTE